MFEPILPFLCFHSITGDGGWSHDARGVQHQQAHAWIALIVLIVCLTLGSCGGDAEQQSAESGVVSTPEEELSGNATTDARRETAAAVGRVVAGKNLGMIVSGAGSTAPTRSLDVLEQRVQSFLPHLQAVYERERQKQPNLMGSVDVYLTIEPNGNVSDLRFPKARVSDERFLDALFDPITTWVFPQAEDTAQLRITFLFVPPSFDLASVTAWERQVVPTSHAAQRKPAAATVIAGAVLPHPQATSPPTLSPSPIPALVPTLPGTTGEGEESSITVTDCSHADESGKRGRSLRRQHLASLVDEGIGAVDSDVALPEHARNHGHARPPCVFSDDHVRGLP